MRGYLPEGVDLRKSALSTTSKSINKGLLKVFSKMGISTLQSYRGAQVFEAIGLNKDAGRQVLHRHALRASKASGSTCWRAKPP